MSHRAATNATHHLTATRSQQTGTDDHGTPVYGDDTTVVDSEPVVYRPAQTTYIRTETGERVVRSPTVKGRCGLLEDVREGDDLTLTPIGGDGPTLDGLEAAAVNPTYGRGTRPQTIVIEVRDV